MTRKARPLAALATVALIGAVGAGCGSDGSTDTGASSDTGAAGYGSVAGSAGTTTGAGTTGSKNEKRAADRSENPRSSTRASRGAQPVPASGSQSSPGLPSSPARSAPPPARRLPGAAPERPGRPGALSPRQMSTQTTNEVRRHE